MLLCRFTFPSGIVLLHEECPWTLLVACGSAGGAFFQPFCVWKRLYDPFLFERFSPGVKFHIDRFFFFQYFKDFALLFSCLYCFQWELCCYCYFVPIGVYNVFFFLTAFEISSLSLVLSRVIMIFVGVVFFVIPVLGVCWSS